MSTLVFVDANGITCIYDVGPGQTAASQAATVGVTDPALYQEFDSTDFDPACYNFPSAFALAAGVVSFDLPTAKDSASSQVRSQTATEQQAALEGYTPEVLAAQATLPELSRTPEIQASIVEVNDLNATLQANLTAIGAATTIDEVNNIVNPPTGTISTGRGGSGGGPLDMNPSTMVTWNSVSMDVTDTELYIPATTTTVLYNGALAPYTYAQTFGAFTLGNYTVQLRQTSTSLVIAEWECPDEAVNVPINF
jgi:hypothetical protein